MKDRDWQNLFGRAPAEFIDQVDEALNRLEEEREMKRRYMGPAVLIAALIVGLMAGAAVAAGMGLIGRVNDIEPVRMLPEAEELVQKKLGEFDLPMYDVIVEEAIHDGYRMYVQLKLIPDDANHALFNTEYPEPDKKKGMILYDDEARHPWNVTGRMDGKQVLFYDLRMSSASEMEIQYLDVENNEDGSVSVWFEGIADEPLKDGVRLTVRCLWGLLGDFSLDMMRGASSEKAVWLPEDEEIRFTVETAAEKRHVQLEPVGESETGEMTFYSCGIDFTPMRGYYTIRYYCVPNRKIAFFDAEGNPIETGMKLNASDGREGDVRYREITGEMQTMETLPDRMYVALLDDDGGVLDRIECRVTEETE